jgi:hypothetical protein
MFNPKMESINKEMTKSTPKHNVFLLFLCFENIMQQLIFLGGNESFENGPGFWRMWP